MQDNSLVCSPIHIIAHHLQKPSEITKFQSFKVYLLSALYMPLTIYKIYTKSHLADRTYGRIFVIPCHKYSNKGNTAVVYLRYL